MYGFVDRCLIQPNICRIQRVFKDDDCAREMRGSSVNSLRYVCTQSTNVGPLLLIHFGFIKPLDNQVATTSMSTTSTSSASDSAQPVYDPLEPVIFSRPPEVVGLRTTESAGQLLQRLIQEQIGPDLSLFRLGKDLQLVALDKVSVCILAFVMF